jgi:hypothetical protein
VKKKQVPEAPKKEIVAEISYRIFEITDEGHFREPSYKSYGDESYTFEHYKGYSSIDAAKEAILDAERKKDYHYHKEYVILPIVRTSEMT